MTLVCALTRISSPLAKEEQRAVIKNIIGQVEVSLTDQVKWRPARVGMPVTMGNDIRTYVESGADIELESGSVIKIGENTVVTLSKLLQGSGGAASNTSLKVGTGKIWANVKKLTTTKSLFEFETPTAVASIRGTRLGVSVDAQGTAIDVFEGLVMVREKSTGKTVPVATKTSAVIRAGGKGIDVVEFGKKSPADSSHTSKPRLIDPFADTSGAKTAPVRSENRPALFLNITNIIDNMEVSSPDLFVDVEVSEGAEFSVNGTEGATKVKLTPGKNLIAIRAWDQWNAVADRTLSVTYKQTSGLTLSLSSPKDGAIITEPMIPVAGSASPGAKITVNAMPVTVSPSGTFNSTVPIPDEAHDYAINVVARLGDNEVNEERTVTYAPAQAALSLSITAPFEGQVIKQNLLRVTGKTTPRATVSVNGRPATVSSQGNITCDMQFTERDIGNRQIDVIASDDNKEMTKTINVMVDPASPLINTSAPVVTVQEQCSQATRTGKMSVDVFDRTPEDQVTLVFQNNGRSEEYVMAPGDRQFLTLEEGKNSYSIKAFDKAHTMSNVISCVVYYLPGPLVIEIRDPPDNPMVIDNLPPMPRNVPASQMRVEVEIEDNLGNIPETIRYCRLIGDGKTLQMTGNNNYRYYVNIPVTYGSHSYSVQVEDIAGNLMTKRLEVLAK
jgi:hypothetical protein